MLYSYNTKIGILHIEEENNCISKVSFGDSFSRNIIKETSLIKNAYLQICEYFEAKRKIFDLPLKLSGTVFQKSVWSALLEIQYGKTESYKEIAKMIGAEKSYRAVGMACNRNPICIIIPCHRVLSVSGNLKGYAGGIYVKRQLLQLEQKTIR